MKFLMRLIILLAILASVFPDTGHAHGCVRRKRTRKLYGYASWYGPEVKNKLTANGEEFDITKLTAAHRKLPFGTYVRVTRLDSQKSIIVRINDRGPFKWRRIIDLTPAAAEKLDMIEIGITRVRVDVLGKDPPENYSEHKGDGADTSSGAHPESPQQE